MDATRLRVLAAAVAFGCGSDPTPAPSAIDGGGSAGSSATAGTGGGSAGSSATAGSGGGGGGCGQAAPHPAGAYTDNLTISSSGVEREYSLYVPAGYDANQRYPLVFFLHGCYATKANDMFGIQTASGNKAVFAYPQGLEGRCGSGTGWDTSAGSDDERLFDDLIDTLSNELCIDPQRIFVGGHSMGGFMANALGCHRAERFRAIVPVSGSLQSSDCGGTVSALLIHGTDDPVVGVAQGEAARDHWVQSNACSTPPSPTNPEPCVSYSGCSPDRQVIWCPVDGVGHDTWKWQPELSTTAWAFLSSF